MPVPLKSSAYPSLPVPVDLPPTLLLVVDTEEEFDWSAPFSRDARETWNLRELPRLQEIAFRHGAVPLYVADYPVLQDSWGIAWLAEERDAGRCEIGAHLHGWVNPPYEEAVSAPASYGCNLPPDLEHRKIAALTDAIHQAFGSAPVGFRTGRYGVGAQTFRSIARLGYRLDLSLPPHSNFRRDGGPSFYGWSNNPFWADRDAGLISLPITTGFSGAARRLGPTLAPMLDHRGASQLRLPGMLARSGILERARLTPEGLSLEEMLRLTSALLADGVRILTVSLHSSALLPGATAYARDRPARDALLERLDIYLSLFCTRFGGVLASASATDARLRANSTGAVCQSLSAAG